MQMHARQDIETASIERERSINVLFLIEILSILIHASMLIISSSLSLFFFFFTLRTVEWRLDARTVCLVLIKELTSRFCNILFPDRFVLSYVPLVLGTKFQKFARYFFHYRVSRNKFYNRTKFQVSRHFNIVNVSYPSIWHFTSSFGSLNRKAVSANFRCGNQVTRCQHKNSLSTRTLNEEYRHHIETIAWHQCL